MRTIAEERAELEALRRAMAQEVIAMDQHFNAVGHAIDQVSRVLEEACNSYVEAIKAKKRVRALLVAHGIDLEFRNGFGAEGHVGHG